MMMMMMMMLMRCLLWLRLRAKPIDVDCFTSLPNVQHSEPGNHEDKAGFVAQDFSFTPRQGTEGDQGPANHMARTQK